MEMGSDIDKILKMEDQGRAGIVEMRNGNREGYWKIYVIFIYENHVPHTVHPSNFWTNVVSTYNSSMCPQVVHCFSGAGLCLRRPILHCLSLSFFKFLDDDEITIFCPIAGWKGGEVDLLRYHMTKGWRVDLLATAEIRRLKTVQVLDDDRLDRSRSMSKK